MKKVLLLIMLIFLSFMISCYRPKKYEYGDFQYHIFQLNDEGKKVYPDSKNKNVVDKYIRIIGLSEEGKKKEIVIVPHYIDGIEVREVGSPPYNGTGGSWESDLLTKIFVPFPADINVCHSSLTPNLKRVIVLEHGTVGGSIQGVSVTSFNMHDAYGILYGGTSKYGNGFCSNVSYMFNYDEAPNDGYYWIDDYDYGTNITYIPDNPTRDGYIFDGWYKEKECINKWDFDVDKLPEELYNDRVHWAYYQETILYAKWIGME